MSKTEHTPGLWSYDPTGSIQVRAKDAKGSFPVCDIRGWGHLTGHGEGALGLAEDEATSIQDANARLIAAAPDMLEALTNARSQLSALGGTAGVHMGDEDAHESGCDMVQRAVIMKIDSAIAKAEGRS